jgi:hypothetical protein
MKTILGDSLKKYFLEHVTERSKKNFYVVTKPLKVFKKTYSASNDVIVNMIIPVGSIIYVHPSAFSQFAYATNSVYRKMRTNLAYIQSQYNMHHKKNINNSHSGHRFDFAYVNGQYVKPKYAFSMSNEQCTSGIHFFLNVNDAIRY